MTLGLATLLRGPFGQILAVFGIGLTLWAGGYLHGRDAQRAQDLTQEHASLISQADRIEKTLLDAAERTSARLRNLQKLQSELGDYEASLDGACSLSVDDAERLHGF